MQGTLSILQGGLLLLGLFAVMWVVSLWFASRVGGWRRLAELFGFSGLFVGPMTRSASARIRFLVYRRTLRLGVSEQGLFLAPKWSVRLFHPPLLIPWSQIEAEMRGRGIWAWNGLRLTFPAVPNAAITFYARELDIVLPHVGAEGPDR